MKAQAVLKRVCNHPSAGVLLLCCEVATVQFCRQILLGGHASLIQGDPAVWSDGIFAQREPLPPPKQDDKDLAPFGVTLTPKRTPDVPIDDVLERNGKGIDRALGQLYCGI